MFLFFLNLLLSFLPQHQYRTFVVPSAGMFPTIETSDRLWVDVDFQKTAPLRRGDIIVYRHKDGAHNYYMVKRVVGMPGDLIEVGADGLLSINGAKAPVTRLTITDDPASQKPYHLVTEWPGSIDQIQIFEETLEGKSYRILLVNGIARPSVTPLKVPEGTLYLMGDNRDNSKDSRYTGPIPLEQVVGRATYVYAFSFGSSRLMVECAALEKC